MKAWRNWTDADLDAARDELLAAYRAMLALTDGYTELPYDVEEGFKSLEVAMRRLEAIDRKRLAAWNKAMAARR